jgi:hypothetical protein
VVATLGVIELNGGGGLGLARAVERHPNLMVRPVRLGGARTDSMDALVVDAPLGLCSEVVARLVGEWPVPELIESPVAADAEQTRLISKPDLLVSANPLRYALKTRELIERWLVTSVRWNRVRHMALSAGLESRSCLAASGGLACCALPSPRGARLGSRAARSLGVACHAALRTT